MTRPLAIAIAITLLGGTAFAQSTPPTGSTRYHSADGGWKRHHAVRQRGEVGEPIAARSSNSVRINSVGEVISPKD